MAMSTSQVRIKALEVASRLYESAGGNLRHANFILGVDPDFGLNTPEDVSQVIAYLTSMGTMEQRWNEKPDLMFTANGILQVERSISRPTEAVGPFPAMQVIIGGNIGANAQVAIGSNQVSQLMQIGEPEMLTKLLPLVQVVVAELPASAQAQGQASLDALKAEAGAQSPDPGFVKTLANKVLSLAGGVASSAATQALDSYLGL